MVVAKFAVVTQDAAQVRILSLGAARIVRLESHRVSVTQFPISADH